MSSEETQDPAKGQRAARRRALRRQRPGRIGIWPVLWAVTVGVLVFLAFLSASGQPVTLPKFVANRIEARLDAAIPDAGLQLGRVEFLVDGEGHPRVRLRDVRVTDTGGNSIAEVNRLGASMSPGALVRGEVAPSVLRVSGAQITVRRDSQGGFTLDFGGMGAVSASGTLAGILDGFDRAFAAAPLSDLERIEAEDVTISLEDARSGRVWQATGGRLTVQNLEDAVSITVFTEVFNGTEDLADVQLSFRSTKGTAAASLGVTFQNAAARDIALQSPALAYLSLLDATMSGSVRVSVSSDGEVDQLAATLEVADGALRPDPAARPIAFESAQAYLTYAPSTGRIDFSEITARSETLTASATGHAYLESLDGGWPETILGQFRLSDVELHAEDHYPAPLAFPEGYTDLRLVLDPFELEFADAVLLHEDSRAQISAVVGVAETGWTVDLDLSAPEMRPETLLRLWPDTAVPNTRRWVSENVRGGRISDLNAAVRIRPGEKPVAAFDYSFTDAEVRVLKHFPPIVAGAGRASLVEGRYAMEIDTGEMRDPEGKRADLAGSRFVIPRVTEKDGPAELDLTVNGPLPAILSLMDNRPFEIMTKAKRPTDFAEGSASVSADVTFPLKKRIALEDVAFEVRGRLSGVASDEIVPGRSMTAAELDLSVTPERVTISGPARLNDLPLRARWTRALGRDVPKRSTVRADLELTQSNLASLGVVLPAGTVTGQSSAVAEITLEPDAPAAFTVTSDLRGATLSVPPLGWSKPGSTPGRLELSGRASDGLVALDRLLIEAPGLLAEGSVAEAGGDTAPVVNFSRVQAGSWLDASVSLETQGAGRPPNIQVSGGSIDLAALPAIESGTGVGGRLSLDLERLRITDGISLSPFRGVFTNAGGMNGEFEGNVNGGAAVTGAVVPTANGAAVRVRSDKAGFALRDAGIIENARSGELDLILVPKPERGSYEGQLNITSIRLRDAPILAGLLDAVSIVGIIDQLQGPGIVFDTVQGRFDLSPERVVIREGSAVGASLGISMDGTYEPATRTMDMQGVISPIYLVNGIGQIFTRRGEGLFGFTYRMQGERGRTRITVNPLSILTPGIFREIFRRPPPEPTQ